MTAKPDHLITPGIRGSVEANGGAAFRGGLA